jgi:hypothetical protein
MIKSPCGKGETCSYNPDSDEAMVTLCTSLQKALIDASAAGQLEITPCPAEAIAENIAPSDNPRLEGLKCALGIKYVYVGGQDA